MRQVQVLPKIHSLTEFLASGWLVYDFTSLPRWSPYHRADWKKHLGGKGAFLVEMGHLGLRIPPGFIITTKGWRKVLANEGQLTNDIWQQILIGIKLMEESTSTRMGDPKSPLIFSIRSGAPESMPGMMDTILNVGINDETVNGLSTKFGAKCAWEAYARLIEQFGISVGKLDHRIFESVREKHSLPNNSPQYFHDLVKSFKKIIKSSTGTLFEQNVSQQLRSGVEAVFESFMNPAAIDYRNRFGIAHDIGTAVVVQKMVYGNSGRNSGSGVVFTRDPQTGAVSLNGHLVVNGQGEDVVAGNVKTLPLARLPLPIRRELKQALPEMEKLVGGAADIEFTWEKDVLYLLQARLAKLPPLALVKSSLELMRQRIISRKTAFMRITPELVAALTRPYFQEKSLLYARKNHRLLATGEGLYSGVGVGRIYFTPETAKAALKKGEPVIFICNHFNPNDDELVFGVPANTGRINSLQALVTTLGSPSSHMGLILKAAGVAGIMGVVGIDNLDLTNHQIHLKQQLVREKEYLSVDSFTGEIFRGKVHRNRNQQKLPTDIRSLVKELEKHWGHNNHFAPFLFSTSKSLDRKSQLQRYKKTRIQAETKYGQAAKAVDLAFLADVLPLEISIPSQIIPVTDFKTQRVKILQQLNQAIHQVRIQGGSVYLRSDNGQLKAPYTAIDVANDPQSLNTFLSKPNDVSTSKWGGLENWINQEGVRFLFIPQDPRDKLNPAFKQEHFVGTVRAEPSLPTTLIVDIVDGTYHLRSFEEIQPAMRMQILVLANSAAPGNLGQISFHFGLDHFDQDKIQHLTTQLAQPFTPQIRALRFKLMREMKIRQLPQLNLTMLVKTLEVLMHKKILVDENFALFIKDRSLEVITNIRETILNKWWITYALPHLLWSLQEVSGAQVLEFQGRLGINHWLKMYGTKGEEETAKKKSKR